MEAQLLGEGVDEVLNAILDTISDVVQQPRGMSQSKCDVGSSC